MSCDVGGKLDEMAAGQKLRHINNNNINRNSYIADEYFFSGHPDRDESRRDNVPRPQVTKL